MQQNQKPRKKFDFLFYLLIIVVIIGVFLLIRNLTRPNPKTLTYADLVVAVEQQKIDSESLSAQPAGGQNYDMFTISGRVKNAEGQWEVFYAVVTMDQFNDLTQTYDLAIDGRNRRYYRLTETGRLPETLSLDSGQGASPLTIP